MGGADRLTREAGRPPACVRPDRHHRRRHMGLAAAGSPVVPRVHAMTGSFTLTDALAADPQAALGAYPHPLPPAGPEHPDDVRRRRLPRLLDALLAVVVAGLCLAMTVVAVLATTGTRPRIELSDSMRPVLRAGDVLWLDQIPARAARRGDVVAFQDPERPRTVLHRVRAVHPDRLGRLVFRTRGDANTGSETWRIASDGALGRYTGLRIPGLGRVAAVLHGLPLVISALVSSLLLAWLALRRIWSS